MKLETAKKRIKARINKSDIKNLPQSFKDYIAKIIYDDYLEFRDDEGTENLTDSQHLDYACVIWLEDGQDGAISIAKEQGLM